jgi:hypothetical protein
VGIWRGCGGCMVVGIWGLGIGAGGGRGDGSGEEAMGFCLWIETSYLERLAS